MPDHFISTSSSDPFDASPTVKKSSSVTPHPSGTPSSPSKTDRSEASYSGKQICPFCYTKQKLRSGYPCPNETCYSFRKGIPLPVEVFTHELFPIVIAGASSAGKSHFLATLKHSLVDKSFWGEGEKDGGYWIWKFIPYFNPNNADNQSVDNPYILYEKNLYNDHPFTLGSTKKDDEHPPLLLTLEYLQPIRRMFEEPLLRKKSLLVAITDTAGEHFDGEAIGALEKNYPALKKLGKGFIVILDPTKAGGAGEANTVLSEFKPRRGKAKVPIAVCLSKIDELARMGISGPDSWDWLDSNNSNTDLSMSGHLMLHNIQHNSRAVRKWMEKLTDPNKAFFFKETDLNPKGTTFNEMAENCEDSFKYHSFFAVSALGYDQFKTDADGKLVQDSTTGAISLKNVPKPIRVLDPLLWILWQHGKLGGTWKTPQMNRSLL